MVEEDFVPMPCWISVFGGLLIMMGHHSRSESLFYYFRLEDQVPENHLLRLIDKHISFEFVRRQLKDSYSETGRPSIDPELLLRILLLGYLYGITSERKLVDELRMHLAWRWFTGLGFDEEIPHHSTFKSWKKTGVDGDTKTPSSERDVPMGRVLAHYLREWHKQTPYAQPTDFVFPSTRNSGRKPICSSVFCRVHLRPAAKKAGVVIPDEHRWGLHNLRHSLSNWLVNKAKENPRTVQGILGHSRIQTTLDLYTDEDLDEMIAAQEKFLNAVGFEAGSVQ